MECQLYDHGFSYPWRYSTNRNPLAVCSTMNLNAAVAWRRVFWYLSFLFTASWWSNPCFIASWRMFVASYIRRRHFDPPPGLGYYEYMSWSPLVRIDSTIKRGLYISVVLRPMSPPFIWAPAKHKFQQDNAGLNITSRVWTLFDRIKMFTYCPGLHVLQIFHQ